MAETLQSRGLWHVTLIERDLIEQAGLNPADFRQEFGCFRYRDKPVIVSHIVGRELVVSREGWDDNDLAQLVNGFSKVVEYNPFCKYLLKLELPGKNIPGLTTYEWDKINPEARFKELSETPSVTNLVRI